MILAPTLTLNTPSGSRLDADAVAFAAASGATDVASLSKFVKGVKDLGLWNSMVCWPLRSSQNAGTGTTAYSLGGLGTFNGTLVNGPTWGADGITFVAASSQRISTSATLDVLSAGAVYNSTSNSNDQTLVSSRNGATYSSGINFHASTSGNRAADVAGAVGLMRATVAGAVFGSYLFSQATFTAPNTGTASNTTLRRDTENRATGSYLFGSGDITSAITPLTLAAEGPLGTNRWLNGILSVVYVSTTMFSVNQQDSFYALYKQTLGTGLGLP